MLLDLVNQSKANEHGKESKRDKKKSVAPEHN